MTARLNPYIAFPGNARAALEFYREVLGGELKVNTFGDYGDSDAPGADRIMHGVLETPNGFTLMANDVPTDADFDPGGPIAVSLSGPETTDGDVLRGCWEGLSTGAEIMMPLAKQVWGDEFGMCADKFGVRWMVNIVAD